MWGRSIKTCLFNNLTRPCWDQFFDGWYRCWANLLWLLINRFCYATLLHYWLLAYYEWKEVLSSVVHTNLQWRGTRLKKYVCAKERRGLVGKKGDWPGWKGDETALGVRIARMYCVHVRICQWDKCNRNNNKNQNQKHGFVCKEWHTLSLDF